jgi:hypothetical protein
MNAVIARAPGSDSDFEDDNWEKPPTTTTKQTKQQRSTPNRKITLGAHLQAKQTKEEEEEEPRKVNASMSGRKERVIERANKQSNASSSSWSDEDDQDFQQWQPGAKKPQLRNFGNAQQSARQQQQQVGFGNAGAQERRGFLRNKRARQLAFVVVAFLFASSYFRSSSMRKERRRMDGAIEAVREEEGVQRPRRAGGVDAVVGVAPSSAKKKRSEYDVEDLEESLNEKRERVEQPREPEPALDAEETEEEEEDEQPQRREEEVDEEEDLSATADNKEEADDDDSGEEPIMIKKKGSKEDEEEEEEESTTAAPATTSLTSPTEEEETVFHESSSEHLETLKSNHEEMTAHPDIGKHVSAIPKASADKDKMDEEDLKAPPKPEVSNAPPTTMKNTVASKKKIDQEEPPLTKVPTNNVGKLKDKIMEKPSSDAVLDKEENVVEDSAVPNDANAFASSFPVEGEEIITDDEAVAADDDVVNDEEANKEVDVVKMLDVTEAGSSEGFDLSTGFVTDADAEIATEEENSSDDGDEVVKASSSIPAKKMKLPSISTEETSSTQVEEEKVVDAAEESPNAEMSDSEIAAFVADGTLPKKTAKEEAILVVARPKSEPDVDDVLDLKRAGIEEDNGFDFSENLATSTEKKSTAEDTQATEEEEVQANDEESTTTTDGAEKSSSLLSSSSEEKEEVQEDGAEEVEEERPVEEKEEEEGNDETEKTETI